MRVAEDVRFTRGTRLAEQERDNVIEERMEEIGLAVNENEGSAIIAPELPSISADTRGRLYLLAFPTYGTMLILGTETGWRVLDHRPHSLQAMETNHLAPPALNGDISWTLLAETVGDPLIEMPASPGTVINVLSGPAYEFALWLYVEWSGNNNSATFELYDGGVPTGRTITLDQPSNQAPFNSEATIGLFPEDPGLAGTVHAYSVRFVSGDAPTMLRANATITAIGWPDFT